MFGINDKRIFNSHGIDLHSTELIDLGFDNLRHTTPLRSFPDSNSASLQEDVIENIAQEKLYIASDIRQLNQKNKHVSSLDDKKEGLFPNHLRPGYANNELSIKYKHISCKKNKNELRRGGDTKAIPLHSNNLLRGSEHEDTMNPTLGHLERNNDRCSVSATIDSKGKQRDQILVESFKHHIEVEIEPIMKKPLVVDSLALDFSVLRGMSCQASYASPLRNVPELDVENIDDEAILVSHITKDLENI